MSEKWAQVCFHKNEVHPTGQKVEDGLSGEQAIRAVEKSCGVFFLLCCSSPDLGQDSMSSFEVKIVLL